MIVILDMEKVLNYKEWRKFEKVIQKAKESCENSEINALDQFVGADKLL